MKFEENWPRVSEEKLLEGMDERWTDDKWQVVTIAHPEPSAQVS